MTVRFLTHAKSLLWILLVCGLVERLFAQDKPYTLRMALGHNPRSSWVKACFRFEEEVEQASKGRLVVDVFHSGQLGSTRQGLELVYINALEAAVPGAAQLEAYVKELGIVVLPFVWRNEANMFAALDGDLGDVIEGRLNVSARGINPLKGSWHCFAVTSYKKEETLFMRERI
ncbi:TRAP transporter substrate-binding protein DctP [Planctomycetota bacterium]